MKHRKELSGLHLFDEITFPIKDIDLTPRIVSLAITNKCNFSCPYCYNLNSFHELDLTFLKDFF